MSPEVKVYWNTTTPFSLLIVCGLLLCCCGRVSLPSDLHSQKYLHLGPLQEKVDNPGLNLDTFQSK